MADPAGGRGAQDSPLDVLARQVVDARVNREAVERRLERLPRWRFRRRAELRRKVGRRRRREDQLLDLVRHTRR